MWKWLFPVVYIMRLWEHQAFFGTGIFWGQQGFGGNGGNTPSYPSGTSSSGSLEFNCYRHEEDWTSTYNTQLTKYDHETGETLEGSSFRLYERFDDKDQSIWNVTEQ